MTSEEILRHYGQAWPSPPIEIDFSRGPIHELSAAFKIVRFSPNEKHAMWTYATVCMSDPTDAKPLELHLFASSVNDEIAELLVAVAHYHRTAANLDLGHSVNFGRPWWTGSLCDRGLISLPYLDGPSLEWLASRNEKLRFLWMIPVTQSEIEFKKEFGLEKLESKFQESGLDYLNPLRGSIIPA
jgi:hypothetical protein